MTRLCVFYLNAKRISDFCRAFSQRRIFCSRCVDISSSGRLMGVWTILWFQKWQAQALFSANLPGINVYKCTSICWGLCWSFVPFLTSEITARNNGKKGKMMLLRSKVVFFSTPNVKWVKFSINTACSEVEEILSCCREDRCGDESTVQQ